MKHSVANPHRLRVIRSIADAPVLKFDQCKVVALATGGAPHHWERRGDGPHRGAIYFARQLDNPAIVKIGYSVHPAYRVEMLRLACALIIFDCSQSHEFSLHRFFQSEHVKRELFAGGRVETFIRHAGAISVLRFADSGWRGQQCLETQQMLLRRDARAA
jgi:hypothetical protein